VVRELADWSRYDRRGPSGVRLKLRSAQLADGCVHNAERSVHNAERSVHNAESGVYNADRGVRRLDSEACNVESCPRVADSRV
jgi:hypothetical protein